MGKVFQNKICDICGIKGKVIETWGKKYCKSCWDAKPKKGKGHSGMVGMQQLYVQNELPFNNNLYLEKTTKGNKIYATNGRRELKNTYLQNIYKQFIIIIQVK